MILTTIAEVRVWEFRHPALRLQWDAGMTIDCDGSGGNPDDDPCYQSDTSLHHNGKALNPYKVPFIVVPPAVRNGVHPTVMGCMAVVINLETGEATQAVVGDQGPEDKIGEASCECANRIGLDSDPNHGGTEEHTVRYIIFPGQEAIVDGIQYELQPS